MTLNDRPKWILAAVGAIAGVTVGGATLASGAGSEATLPRSLMLQDATPVATQALQATSTPMFERSGPIVRAEEGSFTLASSSIDTDSDDSVDSDDDSIEDSTSSVDSVEDSVDSFDSPSSDGTDSVDESSIDSVDSDDSVSTADSPDSVDSVSVDSPDSLDTL